MTLFSIHYTKNDRGDNKGTSFFRQKSSFFFAVHVTSRNYAINHTEKHEKNTKSTVNYEGVKKKRERTPLRSILFTFATLSNIFKKKIL